ncbi:hypothetical protein DVA67_001460 [Solirubrobacter sp. CPCC 204708]|uniref:Uncharacterized protein n=1 Tax=Solirubrobacter deserti TaxID=2282478 RepID=A0ABT4RDM1_9ACTN|nr:hypothetical protein [Solirubrobacter deserti]MBE2314624.1 hypothetical protein [Solirubrobacter deserti]MDA0136631.1 hypothetical protein [Solirubrobacter deserti]
MPRLLAALCLTLLLVSAPAAHAQRPGELDRSFGNGGVVVKDVGTYGEGRYDDAADVLIQRDGKILVIGDGEHGTSREDADYDPGVVRLHPDGSLDGSWGTGGVSRVEVPGTDWVNAGALGPDGKLVTVGQNRPGGAIIRYTTTGAPDTTFGNRGVVQLPQPWYLNAVDVMDDGRIVVGAVSDVSELSTAVVMRFTPTGALDPTFGGGDGRLDFRFLDGSERGDGVTDLAVEPDGDIVVAGWGAWFRRESQIGMARITDNGTRLVNRKTIFLGGDFEDDSPADLVELSEGRFALAINSHGGAANGNDLGVARLTPELSLDPTFGTGGYTLVNVATGDYASGVAVAPDGKLVVSGSTTERVGTERDTNVVVARFTSEGRLDPAFAGTGVGVFPLAGQRALDVAEAVTVDPRDGGIVFAGYTSPKIGFGDFAVGRVLGAYPTLVSITGGPSGMINRRDARFEFAALTEQEGVYECRLLERVAWEPCISPKTYTGLTDRVHQFEVRFVPRGAENEEHRAAVRRFTTDTTAPTVTLDSATPDGADARFTFRASEDGATFRCQIAGREAVDCSSPYRAFDLPQGAQRFTVWAYDAAGNESEPASTSWTVGGAPPSDPGPPPPPPALCPEGAHASVTVGVVTAQATSPAGCFTAKIVGRVTELSSAGPIRVNGVGVQPDAGKRVIVRQEPGSGRLMLTGPSRLSLGEASLRVPLGFNWQLGAQNSAAKLALPIVEAGADAFPSALAGMTASIAPTFELSGDNGGTTKVGFKLKLPSAFRAVPHATKDPFNPNADGGLTLEGGIAASNSNGISYNLKGKLQKAWLFGLELEDVGFGYDSGPPSSFEGFGTIKLPSKADVGVAITLGPGGFAGGHVRKISIQVSKIAKPIGYGFFLQRFGGEFEQGTDVFGRPALTISANAGVSFGPRLELPPIFDGEVGSADAKVKLTVGTPWVVEVSGEGKIVEVPVGNLTVKYTHPSKIDLTGRLDYSLGGYGATGEIRDAWFADGDFSVDGVTDINLPGGVIEGRAETVLSMTGVASCFGQPDARIGFARKWGEPVDVLIGACDVGPFRRERPKAASAAHAFTVGERAKVHVVAVEGEGAAPNVTLVGPGGRRVTTPADGSLLQTREAIVVQDPERATTTVALLDPPAGRWRVETPSAVRAVRSAPGLAPVNVKASVKRGVLRWTLDRLPGQRVTFVERGADGARELVTTARASGRVRFKPGTGRRTVEALVTQDGLPRATRVVARFSGPSPKLRRVAKVTLRGGTLRWRGQAAAARYAVAVEAKDGGVESFTPARASLRVGCAVRRVTIVALSGDGRPGPAFTRRIRC